MSKTVQDGWMDGWMIDSLGLKVSTVTYQPVSSCVILIVIFLDLGTNSGFICNGEPCPVVYKRATEGALVGGRTGSGSRQQTAHVGGWSVP